MEKQKTKYGNDLLISRIGLYQDGGKYIKWVSLDDPMIIKLLLQPKQIINVEEFEKSQETKEESNQEAKKEIKE